jgi:hypothetical protein
MQEYSIISRPIDDYFTRIEDFLVRVSPHSILQTGDKVYVRPQYKICIKEPYFLFSGTVCGVKHDLKKGMIEVTGIETNESTQTKESKIKKH